MRVTQTMLNDTMLWNLRRTSERMEKLQNQITSMQRIITPSDDPIGLATVLRLDSQSALQDQLIENIDDARSWLDTADRALDTIGEALKRAVELALEAANGTLGPDDRAMIAPELKQLLDQVVVTASASMSGQYVFSGQQTRTQPFDTSVMPPVYQGDSGPILRIIDRGITVQINVPGDVAIGPSVDALYQAYTAVAADDTNAIKASVTALNDANTALLAARAELGARENRLAAQRQRLLDLQTNVAQLRSDVQDVDVPAAISDYSTLDLVHRAALQMGARAIQPTLMDYLR